LETFFVDVFLDSFTEAPEENVLDFDATDDPVHGNQEGKFFHGYYRCYCYLPLYVTWGDHVLVAKLRTSDRDAAEGSVDVLARLVARIRNRWSDTRIVLRANQLRLWFSTAAYTLINVLRRVGLRGTSLAKATCGTIRLKLFKIGAQIKISARRILIHFASAAPTKTSSKKPGNNSNTTPSAADHSQRHLPRANATLPRSEPAR
jgi:hypothetical protein